MIQVWILVLTSFSTWSNNKSCFDLNLFLLQYLFRPFESVYHVVATQMGLDASFGTTFCRMFSNSRRSGISILIHFAKLFMLSYYWILISVFAADSLFTGKKDEMFLRGFWLIQIGLLITGTGCGFLVHLSFIRYEVYFVPSSEFSVESDCIELHLALLFIWILSGFCFMG